MDQRAHALVNVRDINLLCQYYKTYAQIEGWSRHRKITRAQKKWDTAGQNSVSRRMGATCPVDRVDQCCGRSHSLYGTRHSVTESVLTKASLSTEAEETPA